MAASFLPDLESEIRHFHLFCGLGGFARGMNRAQARVGASWAAARSRTGRG